MKSVLVLFFIALTGCAKLDSNKLDPGLYCNKETGAGIIVDNHALDLRNGVYIPQGACSMGNTS